VKFGLQASIGLSEFALELRVAPGVDSLSSLSAVLKDGPRLTCETDSAKLPKSDRELTKCSVYLLADYLRLRMAILP
jgi:hypothetical protein